MTSPSGALALPRKPVSPPVEVVVFDQDPVSRHVLSTALSEIDGIEVVDAADDVAVLGRRRLGGHVAVVSAAHDRAVEAAAFLAGLGLRVLCLGIEWTRERLEEMFRAGVAGCLVKEISITRVAAAVQAVASGCVVLSDELRDMQSRATKMTGVRLTTPAPPTGTAPEPLLASLTDRELEVLELLAAGWSTAEAATRLSISKATVKSHVSHTLTKLSVRNRVEAVLLVRHLLDRRTSSLELQLLTQPTPAR